MRLRLIDDIDDARELWGAFGDGDTWPGDDHTYWIASIDGNIAGMCSAVCRHDKGYVYLSYGVVDRAFRGASLQRQMIRKRLKWGKEQGAVYAVTYTLRNNYPSIVNLLRCGFRFADKPRGWCGVGNDVHYFERQL